MSKSGYLQRLVSDRAPDSIVKASLLAFSVCLVALTSLAWGISFVCKHFFHLGYPFSTQLFNPAERFTDLTYMDRAVRDLWRGAQALREGALFNYPAPSVYVSVFFLRLFRAPGHAMAVFIFAASIVALLTLRVALSGSSLNQRWIILLLLLTGLCSYPFAFVVDRGNLEGVVWFFSFLGLAFFIRRRYLISALFFAAAISVKPFPALFVFLFLNRRRYWEIVAALVAVCAANLAALKAIGPTVAAAYDVVQYGFREYVVEYAAGVNDYGMNFEHGWFSLIKDTVRLALGWPPGYPVINVLHHDMGIAYAVWVPVSAVIVLVCVIYFRRKPVLNQLFAIVLLILLLPPASYDYTLIHLYLPWGAFMIFLIQDVARGKVEFSLAKSLWILFPCAVVMTPQSYLTLSTVGFAGQLKALVLTVLFIAIARIDMPSSLFGELPA